MSPGITPARPCGRPRRMGTVERSPTGEKNKPPLEKTVYLIYCSP